MAVRIYVDMCADLFHAGHVAFLKQCKDLFAQTYLIVGLHSDATMATYKRTPICTLEERAAVVSACRYVDQVLLNAPLVVDDYVLQQTSAHLVIHGDQISASDRERMYSLPITKKIYLEVPRTPCISTTEIIERIRQRFTPPNPTPPGSGPPQRQKKIAEE
jgi:cytidyltransferase-like protein